RHRGPRPAPRPSGAAAGWERRWWKPHPASRQTTTSGHSRDRRRRERGARGAWRAKTRTRAAMAKRLCSRALLAVAAALVVGDRRDGEDQHAIPVGPGGGIDGRLLPELDLRGDLGHGHV